MKIIPIKENENVGFHYSVTDEQLAERAKMTTEEIINWCEETAKFIINADICNYEDLNLSFFQYMNIDNFEITSALASAR